MNSVWMGKCKSKLCCSLRVIQADKPQWKTSVTVETHFSQIYKIARSDESSQVSAGRCMDACTCMMSAKLFDLLPPAFHLHWCTFCPLSSGIPHKCGVQTVDVKYVSTKSSRVMGRGNIYVITCKTAWSMPCYSLNTCGQKILLSSKEHFRNVR